MVVGLALGPLRLLQRLLPSDELVIQGLLLAALVRQLRISLLELALRTTHLRREVLGRPLRRAELAAELGHARVERRLLRVALDLQVDDGLGHLEPLVLGLELRPLDGLLLPEQRVVPGHGEGWG